jgi:hemerythrin-like domain-containing protein
VAAASVNPRGDARVSASPALPSRFVVRIVFMLRDRSLVPLSQQHHNGLALCVLTERSLAEDSSEANVARLSRRAVDRYEIELTNHFEIEEKILFPAILRELGESALVAELIEEHRRIEGLADRLRTQPSRETLDEFTVLLRTHIRKEENVLFEDIQQRLSRPTLNGLGSEIEAKVLRVCLE